MKKPPGGGKERDSGAGRQAVHPYNCRKLPQAGARLALHISSVVANTDPAVSGTAVEPTSTYRADIDGLRAVAVLAVVLYHFGVWPITGGFVGVDVFFVISGYLITQIIRRELAAGSFSFWRFYERRFRRILPALMAVIVGSMAAGWVLLLPGDYADLGMQGRYAAFGLSNFYFLWNTSYFDQTSDMLPLLHTWSLAVEEQFYVFWPIILALLGWAHRMHRASVLVGVLSIVAVSFTLAVVTVSHDPSEAFYMLHTRAWELAAGGLVTFAPAIKNRWHGELANALGMVFIVASALQLTSDTSFPGWAAAPAVIGASAVVWPKEQPGLVQRVLSVRPAVFLGLMSYSFYLWHWPVLVFFRFYSHQRMPSPGETVILLCFCVGLSYLSWRFIERPFRRGWRGPKTVIPTGLVTCLAVATCGHAIAREEGVPTRIPTEFMGVRSLDVMWEWDCPFESPLTSGGVANCVFGIPWEESDDRVLLWGDSHAQHFAPLLQTALEGSGKSVMLYYACTPVAGGSVGLYSSSRPDYSQKCERDMDTALEALAHDADIRTIVIASFWSTWVKYLGPDADPREPKSFEEGLPYFRAGLVELMAQIATGDRKVILMSTVPAGFMTSPTLCNMATALLRSPCALSPELGTRGHQEVIRHILDEVSSQYPNVAVLHPARYMCSDTGCITSLNGEPLYRDQNHLRRNLSQTTREHLVTMFEMDSLLAEQRATDRR